MRSIQSRVLEAIRRARDFLDKYTTLLDVVNKSGARKTLDDVVTQLTENAVNQDNGARVSKGETANQRTLRLAIRFNYIKPINEVAKLKLRDVPNFKKTFAMPPSDARGPRIAAAAVAMADAATPFAQTFIDAGLPADFITQLRDAAETLNVSLDNRAQGQGKRAGASRGLRQEERRGRGVLKLLDALVIPKLGTNDKLIAEWNTARKIHARLGPLLGTVGAARTGAAPVTAPVSTVPAPALPTPQAP